MKLFKDNAGRDWSVSVNVATLKRVRDLLNVDLLDMATLEKLSADPVLLVDVLYVICRDEAKAGDVTDEQFGVGLAGDSLDAATTAMMEELVSFFPPRRRAILRKIIDRMRGLESKQLDLIEQRIDGGELDRIVEESLARLNSGKTSTSSPASSA